MTWHQGKAYGISKYGSVEQEIAANRRRQNLVCSEDGIHWQIVAELKVPGGDEATVRFLPDGRMVALIRRELPDHWSGDGPRSSSSRDLMRRLGSVQPRIRTGSGTRRTISWEGRTSSSCLPG